MSSHTRNVPMSEDRMREAIDKQAKQKALRDALDIQMKERGPETPSGPTKGLSKAQQKFQELQKLRADTQQQEHQTMSLPANFSMVGNTNQMGNSRFVQNAPVDSYQTGSLPANFSIPSPSSPPRPAPQPSVPYNPVPPEPQRVEQRVTDALPPRMVFDHSDLMNFVTKATEEPPGAHAEPEDGSSLPVGVVRARAHIQKGKEVKQRREAKADPPPRGSATPQARRPPTTTALGDKHMQVKVDRLQRELEEREAKMHKLMEKERNWEEQMRELKGQLKRQKGAALKAPTTGSTRAETAPVSLPEIPPSKKKLEPIERPKNVQAGAGRPKVQAGTPVVGGAKAADNRRDFNSTKRYAEGAFRPITAPNTLEPLPAEARSSANALPPLTRSGLLKNTLIGNSNEGESIYKIIRETAHEVQQQQRPPPPPKDGTKFSYNQKPFNLDDVVVGDEDEEEPFVEEESEMINSQVQLAFHSKRGNSTMLRNGTPVCVTESHLEYFSSTQIITRQQKDKLWSFFQELGRERLQSRGTGRNSPSLECEEDFVGYAPTPRMVSPPRELLETAPPEQQPTYRRPSPPASKLPQPSGRRHHEESPDEEEEEGAEEEEEEWAEEEEEDEEHDDVY